MLPTTGGETEGGFTRGFPPGGKNRTCFFGRSETIGREKEGGGVESRSFFAKKKLGPAGT